MALTFVCTGELIGARWEEFAMEEERWNIPAERMKMRTPHIVPLSRQTIKVLDALYLEPRAGMMQEWADHLDRIRQNVRTMVARDRGA